MKENNWIDVRDKKPTHNNAVLVYCAAYKNISTGRFLGDNTWEVDRNSVYGNVTHWQPLPKPPKD